jgi:NAD dependent epimerase/dehydratase family enzyme
MSACQRSLGWQASNLHRPTLLPAPGFGIKAVVGGFADEVLVSARIVPEKLLADGFTFDDPTTQGRRPLRPSRLAEVPG